MHRRLLLIAAAALTATLGASAGAQAADPMKVSASFSILGDMVKEVGGDRVQVFTFVGPNGDAHVYEPTPADAKELSESKILFINGLDLEGWMTRLEKSSGFKGTVVTASKGVSPREIKAETMKLKHPVGSAMITVSEDGKELTIDRTGGAAGTGHDVLVFSRVE